MYTCARFTLNCIKQAPKMKNRQIRVTISGHEGRIKKLDVLAGHYMTSKSEVVWKGIHALEMSPGLYPQIMQSEMLRMLRTYGKESIIDLVADSLECYKKNNPATAEQLLQ